MLKLFKTFTWKHWLSIFGMVICSALFVFCSMQAIDCVSKITISIGKAYAAAEADKATYVNEIWQNGAIMLAYAVGIGVALVLLEFLASYTSANIVTSVRDKLYQKINAFALSDFNKFSTESLITRATNDIQNIHLALITAFRTVFMVPIMIIWAIVRLLGSDTTLTVASAIWIILLIIAIVILLIVVLPKYRVMQKYTDALNVVTRENLTGVRVVRAFNAEKYQEDKFEVANKNFTKAQIFAGKAVALFTPLVTFVMHGVVLTVLWVTAFLMEKLDLAKASELFANSNAFVMLVSQVILSFVLLISLILVWPRAVVCAQRVTEVLGSTESILDPETPEEFKEKGTIEFKDVSFAYPGGGGNVISNINFKVKQGETLAFIGATGSGKTTAINLIPRIYDVTEGEVLVDGVNVKNVRQKDLRDIIGYAPQRGYLFRGTVKENIAFSDPDMDMDRIIAAAKVAEADGFVSAKEEGYDGPVSQGGTNFSGGQKQRLCIARAVAKKAEILIFDDSFSALDYKTDRLVRSNIKQFDPSITRVIIAQRIGTIMDADQIVVLDKGQMVGLGKHEDLMKNCQVYKEIALSQLSKSELGLEGKKEEKVKKTAKKTSVKAEKPVKKVSSKKVKGGAENE